MITEQTKLVVADNTGARCVRCFRIIGRRSRFAHVGDVIKASVREAQPDGLLKKGQVCDAVIVRTKHPIRRQDGSYLKFDDNAVVIIDETKNPVGTRVMGPVARELRDKNFMKVVSLAAEVL